MKTLHSLELFRGIAACMIVMSHNSKFYFNTTSAILPFGHIPSAGRVEFFFVLSGFIMLTIHKCDFGKINQLKDFGLKRVARLYPFYWIVLLLMYCIPEFMIHFKGDYPTWKTSIKDLFLMVNYDRSMAVVWTLEHEIVFYWMFASLLINKRAGVILLSTWLSAIIYANFIIDTTFATSFFLSTYNLGFFIGMLAAHVLMSKRQFANGRLVILLACVCFTATGVFDIMGYYDLTQQQKRLMFEFSGAILIIGGVYTERTYGFHRYWLAKVLGKASYSIYLTHLIFNVLIYWVLDYFELLNNMDLTLSASIAVIGSITLACLTSKYIEMPICKYARNKLITKN